MGNGTLLREVAAFRSARQRDDLDSANCACLHLIGVKGRLDLEGRGVLELAQFAKGLRQQLVRERLRGMARHRCYDLNRHIALKRALDAVLLASEKQNGAGAPS